MWTDTNLSVALRAHSYLSVIWFLGLKRKKKTNDKNWINMSQKVLQGEETIPEFKKQCPAIRSDFIICVCKFTNTSWFMDFVFSLVTITPRLIKIYLVTWSMV